MPASDPLNAENPPLGGAEAWPALAAWAAEELRLAVRFDGKAYLLESTGAPAASPPVRGWRGWLPKRPAGAPPYSAASPAELVDELLRRLRDRRSPIAARPLDASESKESLTQRFAGAYRLDGGEFQLAACRIEERPLVRLTWVREAGDSVTAEHRYFDELGSPVPWNEVDRFGGDRLAPLGDSGPRADAGRVERMLASSRRAAGEEQAALATIVWAPRVEGVVRLAFGTGGIEAPFEGWLRSAAPPAAVCPQTGVFSRAFTALADGRVVAASEVGACAVSQTRVLRRELVRCSLTGVEALAEHVGACAATGRAVLCSRLARCGRCGLASLPTSVQADGCAVCRSSRSVSRNDPRLQAVFAKHPRFAGRRWRLAETPAALVLRSGGWWRRWVVTLDRETLAVLHAAEAPRGSRRWRTTAPDPHQP